MLRQTWARSGRSRRWLGGRLEHDVPAELARPPPAPRRRSVTGRVSPAARCRTPPAARDVLVVVEARQPSRVLAQHVVDQPAGRRPMSRSAVSSAAPSGVRSHTAYSTTRASARTAASTAGYDGTEPRPAELPGDVGDPEQLRHALGAEERGDQRLVGLLPHRGEHVGDVLAGDVERRDVDGDHGVDVGVVDRRVERVLEVLGASRRRPARPSWLTTSPTAAAASAASRPSASELPTTATRRPRGSGWWASSWATSNISSRVSTWITPAWRNIASTACGGAAIWRTAWPIGTPWVVRPERDRDDRLAQRDPARDAGELARVADRLEVEQHDLGGVVLLPVLQQVVAGDVGAVAGADERRQAQAAVVDLLEDRRAQRAGLAEEAGPAARRHQRREGGVERGRRVGVDDAEAVGADQPQPVGAGQPDQAALPLPALLAGLGEAGGDHDQAVHALGRAVEHDVLHRLGGHRHDRPRRRRRGCR